MADRPPEHVYVVCVRSEWPIDVISGEPEVHAASGVEAVVKRRLQSGNVIDRYDIKVSTPAARTASATAWSPATTASRPTVGIAA